MHVVFGAPVAGGHRPGYPGHESAGVVADSSDDAFAEGDLVLAVPNLVHAGGFAHHQLLPPSERLVPLPPGVDPAVSVLAQQLGTTVFGMKRFWDGPADGTAVVLGAGPVGLCFTRLCRLAGFEKVIVSDLHEHRLEAPRAMGAIVTVLAEGDAVVDAVMARTGSGARLVVEAAGTDVTRVQALRCVAVEGRIGMPEGPDITLPFELLFRRKPTVDSAGTRRPSRVCCRSGRPSTPSAPDASTRRQRRRRRALRRRGRRWRARPPRRSGEQAVRRPACSRATNMSCLLA